MSKLQSRRELMLNLTSAGLAGMVYNSSAQAQMAGEIQVRVTAGAMRLAQGPSLAWRPAHGSSADSVILDPARTYQEILGFGASFTDSA